MLSLHPAEDLYGLESLWARPRGNSGEGGVYEASLEALFGGAAGDSLRWITYAQILSLHTCCACLSVSVQMYRDMAFTLVKKER